MKKLVALVGASVFLTACGDDTRPRQAQTVADSAGVRVVTNVLSDLPPICSVSGPTVTIGQESGPSEYQLYRTFGARRLSDGRIVLMDQGSHQLRFYDSTGVFLSSSGREGDGPGEFQRGFYIWVTPGDTLWVGDYEPWRFMVFDPLGQWVRDVQPDPLQYNNPRLMTVLDDGSSVLAAPDLSRAGGASFMLREAVPALHDPTGQSIDTIGVFPMGRYGLLEDFRMSIYPWFEAFTSLGGSGDRFYLGHGSRPEVSVYEVRNGATLRSLVRWNIDDRSITDEDIRAQREIWRERYSSSSPALVEAMVGDDRPVADQLPAFSDIIGDRDGGFWVETYPRPTEPDSIAWLSFDADGEFRCEITLPPLELVDLGREYLLAERESDLGIEQIVMYQIGRPTEVP